MTIFAEFGKKSRKKMAEDKGFEPLGVFTPHFFSKETP